MRIGKINGEIVKFYPYFRTKPTDVLAGEILMSLGGVRIEAKAKDYQSKQ